MTKEFDWQYSWEKILYKKRQNFISFFVSILGNLALLISFCVVIGVISFYAKIGNIGYVISWIILLVFAIRWVIMYRGTYFIITSRRIIKLVREGYIFEHTKELKLLDIQQMNTKTYGILDKIFGYWNLEFQWPHNEEDNVYFKGMNKPKEILTYVWRIIDYIKENGASDDLSSFKSRKERRAG